MPHVHLFHISRTWPFKNSSGVHMLNLLKCNHCGMRIKTSLIETVVDYCYMLRYNAVFDRGYQLISDFQGLCRSACPQINLAWRRTALRREIVWICSTLWLPHAYCISPISNVSWYGMWNNNTCCDGIYMSAVNYRWQTTGSKISPSMTHPQYA